MYLCQVFFIFPLKMFSVQSAIFLPKNNLVLGESTRPVAAIGSGSPELGRLKAQEISEKKL